MRKTEIISKVLSRAVQLWLKTQVSQVENLHVKITGGDRQLLRGYIPNVLLECTYAVYQGIHVGEIQLNGENIRVNLGGILKGKPLRLLEPIKVTGKLILQESQLKSSLSSPLLSQGLTDLLKTLLTTLNHHPDPILQDTLISWSDVTINSDKVTLFGTITQSNGKTNELIIRMGLTLVNSQILRLHPLLVEGLPQLETVSINDFEVDLGPLVDLQEVSLTSGKLSCCGGLMVMPEPEIT